MGLLDEVQKMEKCCQKLKQELDMKMELELSKENYEKELTRELDNMQKNMRMKLELVKELEQERDNMHKNMVMELKLLKEKYEKELEVQRDMFEKNLRMELELSKESYEKKLKGEKDLFDKKLSLVERGNCELVKEFEDKIVVFEENLYLAAMKKVELEAKIEELERKLSLVATEKSALEEKLTREFEVLEGKNRDLEKKRELSNESLGKKLAVVEERLAMLKGVFATVSSANEESNRHSGNDSGGWIIPMSDSHDKASSLKSCQTNTYPSLGNPSSKSPPQRESRDSEGITNGDQLGVMTEGSFLEYEPEAGGYSENSINCKRKRNINGSEDDSDSLGVNKQTKRLLESGCKKNSLPNDLLKNLNPSAPGVSKANLPPKFSSDSIEQYENKNGRHEISELHFRKSVSGAVGGPIDGTNRFPRGDPHEPSPVTKAVAGFRSGKEIEWKHRADMLSAFAKDPELCIAAVCALYRRTISEKVSRNSGGFSSFDCGGFSSFDCVSGTTAAKYLINGDPANKLSKSVSEVQQDRPAILKTCETLAIQHGVQLFEIYQKKLDPFFCSKG